MNACWPKKPRKNFDTRPSLNFQADMDKIRIIHKNFLFKFFVGAHPRVRPQIHEKFLNAGRTHGSAPTGFCEDL